MASGTNIWVIKTQELSLINMFLYFQEQRVVLVSLNFWKKLVTCAEEACQMTVHMYQCTACVVQVLYRCCTGAVHNKIPCCKN